MPADNQTLYAIWNTKTQGPDPGSGPGTDPNPPIIIPPDEPEVPTTPTTPTTPEDPGTSGGDDGSGDTGGNSGGGTGGGSTGGGGNTGSTDGSNTGTGGTNGGGLNPPQTNAPTEPPASQLTENSQPSINDNTARTPANNTNANGDARAQTLNQLKALNIPTVQIGGLEIPLFGPAGFAIWALVNLLLALICLIAGFSAAGLAWVEKSNRYPEQTGATGATGARAATRTTETTKTERAAANEAVNSKPAKAGEFSHGAFQPFAKNANGDRRAAARERKFKDRLRLISAAVGILSIAVFFLTENIHNLMVFVDIWTWLMLAITLAQALILRRAFKKRSGGEGGVDGSNVKKAALTTAK
jgi:hypothetical protein